MIFLDISSISSALQAGNLLGTTGVSANSQPDGTEMFGDLYSQLVGSVNQTDATFQADILKASEGELDNPAQLVIDSSKAQVALQLTSSVRNTALQAYREIMSMQV